MEKDEQRLRQWIGRQQVTQDCIAIERCRAMQAALDQGGPRLREGDPLPPLWHWLYFWTIVPRSGLGRDGHPSVGGFLPPVGSARRMWAGSRVDFIEPISIGDRLRRVSTVTDVALKQGRTGRLVFVTVSHEITGASGITIVDEHDIVYREDIGQGASGTPGKPAPLDAVYSMTLKTDPTLLFRYSALTFNGHRIHYDRDYATLSEGYPGLVVHGPLLATLMVDLASRSWPHRRITGFQFRGHRPIFDTQPFKVCGVPRDDDAIDLWIADADGMLSMQARAEFDRV